MCVVESANDVLREREREREREIYISLVIRISYCTITLNSQWSVVSGQWLVVSRGWWSMDTVVSGQHDYYISVIM